MTKSKFLKTTALSINILLVFLFVKTASAADFLVSWRAGSYVPAPYEGKIFPAKNTLVEISFELINSGKQINLSQTEVRWFLDKKLIKTGLGAKTASFNASKTSGNDHSIKITVVGYNNGDNLDYTTTIPVVSPEVAIDLRRPSNLINSGDNSFQTFPYFFNIGNATDLTFQWNVNGKAVDNNSLDAVTLNFSSLANQQTPLTLGVLAQNPFDQLEMAAKTINLTMQ